MVPALELVYYVAIASYIGKHFIDYLANVAIFLHPLISYNG